MKLLPILLLLAVPVFAQAPKPAPQQAPPPEVTAAIKKYQAKDLKGAIAVLEPLRAKKGAPPAALALLGSLYFEAGRPEDSLAVLGPLAEGDAAGPVILHTAARAALALKDTAKAEAYLEKAVEMAPGSPASRDLGLLKGSKGRISESYRLLLPWCKAHPEDQEARISAAYGAIELDRPPDAQELLSGLPQDDPRVRLLSARLQLLLQKPRDSIAILEPLLKTATPALNLSIRHYLAEAHLTMGQSAEAIALLQGRVGDDPGLALLLARAQYRAGNPADTVATLKPFAERTLGKEPANPAEQRFAASFAREYGQALVATSDWATAIDVLGKAIRYDPQNLQAWQFLGRAQLASGNREEGAKTMARVREIQSAEKPNTERVNEQERGSADPTGRTLEEARKLAAAGRVDEALAMIRQEMDLAPADSRPRAMEITVLIGAKRTEEALKAVERALAGSPGNPNFLYLRGAARMAAKDLAGAEKDYRQTLAAQPAHVGAMNDLAVLLISSNRKDEARELLRKVLEIRPGDPLAAANLKSLDGG